METIGKQKIWSFFDERRKCQIADNTQIRKGPGHYVDSYLMLAKKVAELQFRNRDHVLLFRGQGGDYRNRQNNSTLKSSLFRPERGRSGNPDEATLVRRFRALEAAEARLTASYKAASPDVIGVERLERHRILRWSILQHYEVCPTPLLDVTHSLRIASSFASLPAPGAELSEQVFVYVLGVPNLSGAITASAEAGLQIIRLSSVCPPQAVRPHIQEGYLLGEYPEIGGYQQKARYEPYEVDFGLRLVAKFCFNPHRFWQQAATFPMVPREALYPNGADDPLHALAHGQRLTPARRAAAASARRARGG